MKARYLLCIVLAAAVAVSFGCGKKGTEETAPAPSGPAPSPIDMSTVGVVEGGVTLDGTPPPAMKINMASEPSCAQQHAGAPAVSQEVVVGANHALQNVIVYVKDGLGDRTFSTPTTAVTIDQKGCTYVPHVISMMAGQELEVRNNDPVTHNIHPTPKNNQEWNQSQPPGSAPIEKTFARAESSPPIPVKCNVHPWMKSYIAVFNHPYFAVSSADGKFTLKDLPPGTYTIEAWHEKYGTSDQTVTIGPKETKTITFVFKAAAAGD